MWTTAFDLVYNRWKIMRDGILFAYSYEEYLAREMVDALNGKGK